MIVSGAFDVPLSPQEAFVLFTARGERRWAEGWDPRFPAGDEDDTIPGTTFVIDHHGVDSVWVVASARPPHEIAYVRVTPGDKAGTVLVQLEPRSGRSTRVTVTYDLTALTPEARAELADFEAGYEDFLGHWAEAIASAI